MVLAYLLIVGGLGCALVTAKNRMDAESPSAWVSE
jgi:hypothetical protein